MRGLTSRRILLSKEASINTFNVDESIFQAPSPYANASIKKIKRELKKAKKKMDKTAGHMIPSSGGLEGRMAKRQLLEIVEMAEELFQQIHDYDDLPEWCQVKLATIHDRLHSVHSYMSYEHRYPKMHPSLLGRLMPKMASKDCNCGCDDCEASVKLAGVKKEYQNPQGGLNAKGRAYFKRTQGSNLKRPVSMRQAQKSPKSAARRRSFCSRMGGMKRKHSIDCSKNPNKSICKALRKWDC